MRKIAVILFVLVSALAMGQANQIDVKKAVVRDWIIYQGDTLTVVSISGDTIFTIKGATRDTLISGEAYWSQKGSYLYPSGDWNVGIGTTTPDEELEVVGNVKGDTAMFDYFDVRLSDINQATSKLVNWKYDFAKAFQDNTSTATINNANIVVIGDSYAPSYGYPLKEIGGYKYGFGGGYEIFEQVLFEPYGYYCSYSGWAEGTSTTDAYNWNERYIFTKTDAAQIKISGVQFNKLRINYKKKSGYGKFSVQLNSLTPDTVDCNATAAAGWFVKSWPAATYGILDTIYINAIGTDSLMLFGNQLEMNQYTYSLDNKKGNLNVHILENGGSSIYDRYRGNDTATIRKQLDTLDASLAILSFLDTDAYNPDESMDTLISYLQAMRPEMDILVLVPNATYIDQGNIQQATFREVADKYGAAYLNLYNLIGSFDDLNAIDATLDSVHLSSIGKYLVYKELEKVLFSQTKNTFEVNAWKVTNRGDYMIFPRSQNIAVVSKDVGNMASTANNTFFGYRSSAFVKPSGTGLTYIGSRVGETNAAGTSNTGIGNQVLRVNTSGSYNTAVGENALLSNNTDSYNTAFGFEAGRAIAGGGEQNFAGGAYALYSNTTGDGNVAIGHLAGLGITGNYNVSIGYNGMYSTATGNGNTAVGSESAKSLTSAAEITAFGKNALNKNKTGSYNTAIGAYALYSDTTGANNVALGYKAGYYEMGGDKLYIENSDADSTGALIFGNFATDKLTINGDVTINENSQVPLTIKNTSTVGAYIQYHDYYLGDDTTVWYVGAYNGEDDNFLFCYNDTNNPVAQIYNGGAMFGLINSPGIVTQGGDLTLTAPYTSDNINLFGDSIIIFTRAYDNDGLDERLIIRSNNPDYGDSAIYVTATCPIELKSSDSIIFNSPHIYYNDTFWDDLTFPATTTKLGSTSKPVFSYTEIGLLFPYSDSTELTVYGPQMKHSWKAGTDIYPHVHWIQAGANDTAEFILKYRWTDMGETVGAWTRIETTVCTVYPYSSGSLHQLAIFPAISGSGHTESSILDITLFRKEDVGLNGDILVKDFDIHFEIDKPGSDNEIP